MLNGKADSQPEDGLAAVFVLVSPFIGFRRDSRWAVRQDDGRLDLVAVLSARSGSAGPDFVALFQEQLTGH